MVRWLTWAVVAAALAGCAATRSKHVYSFQRPITDGAPGTIAVSDADWTACDRPADYKAVLGAHGVGSMDSYSRNYYAGNPDWKYAEELYEYEMRKCLRKRGYAIEYTPRGWDAEGGFEKKRE